VQLYVLLCALFYISPPISFIFLILLLHTPCTSLLYFFQFIFHKKSCKQKEQSYFHFQPLKLRCSLLCVLFSALHLLAFCQCITMAKDDLNLFLCGETADPASSGVLQCKQTGCETQWVSFHIYFTVKRFTLFTNMLQYHLECVSLEQVPNKWVCKACTSLQGVKGGKVQRRWYHITIFRYVPDYIIG